MDDEKIRKKLKKLWHLSGWMNQLIEEHEEYFSHSFGRKITVVLVQIEEVFADIKDEVGEDEEEK